jgi:multisubunit Na+/H+ antiporter MnhG subunit
MVVLGFTHENREVLPLLGVVLFCIIGGLGLIQCGRGYRDGKNYGKAPAVLANLIALGVVKYQVEAELYYIAIPIALLAVATLVTVIKIASQSNKPK